MQIYAGNTFLWRVISFLFFLLNSELRSFEIILFDLTAGHWTHFVETGENIYLFFFFYDRNQTTETEGSFITLFFLSIHHHKSNNFMSLTITFEYIAFMWNAILSTIRIFIHPCGHFAVETRTKFNEYQWRNLWCMRIHSIYKRFFIISCITKQDFIDNNNNGMKKKEKMDPLSGASSIK